jgi:hypothetical protein
MNPMESDDLASTPSGLQCPSWTTPSTGYSRTTGTKSNVLRRLTGVALTGALVASLSLVSLTAAATPASACNTTLRAPYKATTQLVSTRVSNGNCQNNLQSALTRHRWFGWQAVAYKYVNQNTSKIVTWNCSGTGTYTYRADYGNQWHYHNGPQARLSC